MIRSRGYLSSPAEPTGEFAVNAGGCVAAIRLPDSRSRLVGPLYAGGLRVDDWGCSPHQAFARQVILTASTGSPAFAQASMPPSR